MRDLVVTQPGKSFCICCLGEITTAFGDVDPWEAPGGAVAFLDTGNFGSRLYDSAMNGERVEILVCDECLEERDEYLRKYSTPGHMEARAEQSAEALKHWDGEAALKQATDDLARYNAIITKLDANEELTPDEVAVMAEQHGENWQTDWRMHRDQENEPQEVRDQRCRDHYAEIKERRRLRMMENARRFLQEEEQKGPSGMVL